MRLIGNILWLVFGGLMMALGYAVAAIVMFLLIVTIPLGVQALKLASFSLWPFGRTLVRHGEESPASAVGNVIWLLLAGWWIALGHVAAAFALTLTLIGIPFAVAHMKLAITALWPFGAEVMPVDQVPPGSEALSVGGLNQPRK